MNTQQAAHLVVREARYNTDDLARFIGTSGAVLRQKTAFERTPDNRHRLSLEEAVRITEITNDERVLEAWANERNAVVVKLPAASTEPDNEELLEKFLKLTAHYGALAKRHQEATADGEVDDTEMADLRRIGNLIHQTVEEINALTERVYVRTPTAAPRVAKLATGA